MDMNRCFRHESLFDYLMIHFTSSTPHLIFHLHTFCDASNPLMFTRFLTHSFKFNNINQTLALHYNTSFFSLPLLSPFFNNSNINKKSTSNLMNIIHLVLVFFHCFKCIFYFLMKVRMRQVVIFFRNFHFYPFLLLPSQKNSNFHRV